tara:strand:+ start:116 stop:1180 length:1065 start_codon:yes stop_codon:yes gene_type:complete
MAYTTIDDPSAHFQAKIYSGNGSTQTLTNDGNSDLQPDLLWFDNRNDTQVPQLFDTTRGIAKAIRSNDTNAEDTDDPNDRLTAISSDGFSLGDDGNPNNGSNTYVCWQWKANGGTTSSNGDGSTTSTVQANTTAGFSIITYTGTGSNATIGHGLGVTPDFVIVKSRSEAQNWEVIHSALGAVSQQDISINETAGNPSPNGSVRWNALPTSSVINLAGGNTTNKNTITFVAYAWAKIQGYSDFGIYTANNNADGPFIYTGFKPKLIVIKKTTAAGEWHVLDTERDTLQPIDKDLYWGGNYSEGGSAQIVDFLSNGFKLRNNHTGSNGENTSEKFMYMAWAEHPFVSSEGVPATAK